MTHQSEVERSDADYSVLIRFNFLFGDNAPEIRRTTAAHWAFSVSMTKLRGYASLRM
jgi:hypothetical protein